MTPRRTILTIAASAGAAPALAAPHKTSSRASRKRRSREAPTELRHSAANHTASARQDLGPDEWLRQGPQRVGLSIYPAACSRPSSGEGL
jgi:hypothetical protein